VAVVVRGGTKMTERERECVYEGIVGGVGEFVYAPFCLETMCSPPLCRRGTERGRGRSLNRSSIGQRSSKQTNTTHTKKRENKRV
jgi:hypothetical protein